jgi:hypothetical protein
MSTKELARLAVIKGATDGAHGKADCPETGCQYTAGIVDTLYKTKYICIL